MQALVSNATQLASAAGRGEVRAPDKLCGLTSAARTMACDGTRISSGDCSPAPPPAALCRGEQ